MDNTVTIFVRVLSEGEWFGAWAPMIAIHKRNEENVYILQESEVCEEDEYEFYAPGTEVRVEAFLDEAGEEFLGATEALNQPTDHETILS